MKIIQQAKEQTAEVRKAQKSTPYTVSVIGTKEDLTRWKADQAIREAEWQKAQETYRAERRKNAVSIVAMETEAKPLTELEMAEIEYLKRRKAISQVELQTKQNKYNAALTTYRGYEETMGSEKAAESAEQIAKDNPKVFSYQSFKDLCAKVWRNAFDSDRD